MLMFIRKSDIDIRKCERILEHRAAILEQSTVILENLIFIRTFMILLELSQAKLTFFYSN